MQYATAIVTVLWALSVRGEGRMQRIHHSSLLAGYAHDWGSTSRWAPAKPPFHDTTAIATIESCCHPADYSQDSGTIHRNQYQAYDRFKISIVDVSSVWHRFNYDEASWHNYVFKIIAFDSLLS